jgi:hypothetical protein
VGCASRESSRVELACFPDGHSSSSGSRGAPVSCVGTERWCCHAVAVQVKWWRPSENRRMVFGRQAIRLGSPVFIQRSVGLGCSFGWSRAAHPWGFGGSCGRSLYAIKGRRSARPRTEVHPSSSPPPPLSVVERSDASPSYRQSASHTGAASGIQTLTETRGKHFAFVGAPC